MSQTRNSLTYRDAGVDIERGNRLVDRIRPIAAATRRPEVLTGIGGFGGLFALGPDRYRDPVLVSGTDGVGTKLRLAIDAGVHDTIGIDLVAMCVNDVLALGAEPLFFLDYLATGHIDETVGEAVVRGIGKGCEQAGAALIGGETAEMPGMYTGDDYDLAGFCVGVVERDRLVDGSRIEPGDALIGLASSGPHSNGYSLIRKVLEVAGAGPDTRLGEQRLLDLLLEPTRIYVRSVLALTRAIDVRGIAHVTGGGIVENVPRMFGPGLRARLRRTWDEPPVFDWLRRSGGIDDHEMLRTFNCGLGMVLCVPEAAAETALATLTAAGETAWPIGAIGPRDDGEPALVIE